MIEVQPIEMKPIEVKSIQPQISYVQETHMICDMLLKTKFYSKMSFGDLFAIVSKAKSLNIDPMDALNGGLWSINGKVEMSSAMMNQLIRKHGHRIRKDPASDETICILHGKRADNGDEWTESFSIKEAKQAGIYREGGTWGKYPKDMLFARALSRLARQLFPDVIKGCYVEKELSSEEEDKEEEIHKEELTEEKIRGLDNLLNEIPEYKIKCLTFLEKEYGIYSIEDITLDIYNRIHPKANMLVQMKKEKRIEEKNEKEST